MDKGDRDGAGRPTEGPPRERCRETTGTHREKGGQHRSDPVEKPVEMGERGSGALYQAPVITGDKGAGQSMGLRARMTVAAAFAAAALAGMALLAFLAVRAPVEAADRYMRALSEGREEEAWSMLHVTSKFKAEEDFKGYLEMARERTESVTGWKAHLTHLTGSRAYVDLELLRDGSGYLLRLGLRNDGKGWMIYEPDLEERYGGP